MGIPLESAKSSSTSIDEPRLPNTAGNSREAKSDLTKSFKSSSKNNLEGPKLPNAGLESKGKKSRTISKPNQKRALFFFNGSK